MHAVLPALAVFVTPGLIAAPSDGAAWLLRLREAAQHRDFQGTLVNSIGGTVTSSRVAHYGENGHQYERMEMLDGQMRRVFRHNDMVVTLWPERRLAVIEQRDPSTSMPVLMRARPDEHVFERYELRPQGADRVAGHEAQVYLLHPRDGLRFAQRLWMEPHSALLLRVDLLAGDGRVLESAAFSELTLGVRPQPDSVLRPMRKLDGYRVLRPTLVRTRLDAEGWAAPEVPGFEQVSCVKRVLDEGEDGRSGETLQTVYADGLTHVSLFIEPFRGGEHQKPVQTAIGATHTLMQRQGAWWITVVGEVPPATLHKFAAGLVRR
ncbi:MucB/RseB C-terminal domain-containing protein [Azohydromonas caseinilytica]|uniref:Transcriptional regulator n=1 Tax=Azohydromonas caseinilytica TaxID=2728836 RepID=A0A848F9P2_9BURK|nr:MucB/RseB C-terminal domain-containing protein [Azohydromonas caseinilytica]NML15053.1 transcriptional regulator [Azohydromonas caseinilytica]